MRTWAIDGHEDGVRGRQSYAAAQEFECTRLEFDIQLGDEDVGFRNDCDAAMVDVVDVLVDMSQRCWSSCFDDIEAKATESLNGYTFGILVPCLSYCENMQLTVAHNIVHFVDFRPH